MSIESVMPSNHLMFCHPLLLPSIFHSIRVFSNELSLCIMWPNYWSFSFSISPSNEYSGLVSFRIDWFDLLAVQDSLKSLGVFSNTTVQNHQFFGHLMWRAKSLEKTWLGKIGDKRRREATKNKMVGWHHRLNGHEFEYALGDGEGQESLVCWSPWGCKESDVT